MVDLYNGHIDDRHMIYPEYREAVYQDRRPAPPENRWGLEKEFAYEILLSSYLTANALLLKTRKYCHDAHAPGARRHQPANSNRRSHQDAQ